MKSSKSAAPTEVVITIDTEFSAGGAFEDPTGRTNPVGEPNVTGMVDGREHGLGFMLDVFSRYDVPATFFVETLHVRHFGLEPMGALAKRIRDAGHDLQMHLHPLWLAYDGARMVREMTPWPPDDDCAGRSVDELVELMRHGLDVFAAWGLPRPVALRTGGLSVDRNVYRAQANVGLPLASNIGVYANPPVEPALHLNNGRHRIEGVLELPVLCYNDLWLGHYRHQRILQISSTSWREQRTVLERARAAGAETVVILTHPFEFFKRGDVQCRQLRANRLNQNSLDRLCAFVQEKPDEFHFTTFGAGKDRWLNAADQSACEFGVPPAPVIGRIVSNKLNELVWWY